MTLVRGGEDFSSHIELLTIESNYFLYSKAAPEQIVVIAKSSFMV